MNGRQEGLYPPAWRARYRDEVRALLDDSGAGLRSAASLAWRAVPAWVRPPRHLHDRPARMRASLATVLPHIVEHEDNEMMRPFTAVP
jgi:hypothetical protein